jgi:hypothetical protein
MNHVMSLGCLDCGFLCLSNQSGVHCKQYSGRVSCLHVKLLAAGRHASQAACQVRTTIPGGLSLISVFETRFLQPWQINM